MILVLEVLLYALTKKILCTVHTKIEYKVLTNLFLILCTCDIIFSTCRTFAPVVFGTIYSLSVSERAENIGFPFDFHLMFILFSLTYLLTTVIVAFFPKQLDNKLQ